MADHPAVAHLRAALDQAEQLARAAMAPAQFLYPSHPVEFILAGQDVTTPETEAAEAHIRLHMPDAVLRRIAATRELLAEHGHRDGLVPPPRCNTCQAPGWPCRTVLLLVGMWGWEAGDE